MKRASLAAATLGISLLGGFAVVSLQTRTAPDDSDELDAMLDALGYTAGAEGAAHDGRGVVVHDPARAQPGVTLVCAAHAPEAVLIDLDGEIVHRWAVDYDAVFPDTRSRTPKTEYFRRVLLMPDGGLVVVFGGNGIVRIDRDSRVLWAHRIRAHHDLDVDAHGRIVTLTREARYIPGTRRNKPLADDRIAVLAPETGEVLLQVSLYDAFMRSDPEHRRAWTNTRRKTGDALHTNTVSVLKAPLPDHAGFCDGCVLTSVRKLDLIGVVDLDAGRFTWTSTGAWDAQHDPQLVAADRLLLYDNRGPGDGTSAVREYAISAEGLEPVWSWNGSTSRLAGGVQRLANGNTLVTETDGGRIIEVAPDGDVVWEWQSHWRVSGKIARIFQAERVSWP